MKFQKINYSIIGRFENGSKYGIVTRQEVAGYTADGLDGVAIRKRGGFWYVDHVSTGLGVVTVGSKTRDAAAREYTERFKSMVESKPADFFKNAVETFEKAPLESDVATWEMVNFCTTRNYRFDKVTTAARRAGLITKKADDVSYLDGGNINIIGAPEALEPIREMIKAWAEYDAKKDAAETVQDERPENISNEAPEAAETESAPVYTFSETTLTCKGVTFPVEYNIISDGSVLAFVILDVEPSGYRHKQKIVIRPNEPEYAAALEAGSFDLYLGEVRLTADWDVSALLDAGGALNYGGFASEQLSAQNDALLLSGNASAARYAEGFVEETPFAPLLFKSKTVLTPSGLVDGMTPTASDPFYGFADWRFHLSGSES